MWCPRSLSTGDQLMEINATFWSQEATCLVWFTGLPSLLRKLNFIISLQKQTIIWIWKHTLVFLCKFLHEFSEFVKNILHQCYIQFWLIHKRTPVILSWLGVNIDMKISSDINSILLIVWRSRCDKNWGIGYVCQLEIHLYRKVTNKCIV